MNDAQETLDALLPLLEPDQLELHLHATVLETSDMAQLAELATDPKIRGHLLARLSDTTALVDPGQAESLEAALLAAGHTPKKLQGEWR